MDWDYWRTLLPGGDGAAPGAGGATVGSQPQSFGQAFGPGLADWGQQVAQAGSGAPGSAFGNYMPSVGTMTQAFANRQGGPGPEPGNMAQHQQMAAANPGWMDPTATAAAGADPAVGGGRMGAGGPIGMGLGSGMGLGGGGGMGMNPGGMNPEQLRQLMMLRGGV